MDFNTSERTVSDFSDADLSDLMDNEMDMFDATEPAEMVQYSMDNDWLDRFFEDDPVLNDKMMSEALQPPQVRSDHSYSREDGTESPLNLCKADNKGELDLEFLTTAVPQLPNAQVALQGSQAAGMTLPIPGQSLLIKREPNATTTTTTSTPMQIEHNTTSITVPSQMPSISMSQTMVKHQPTIILTTQSSIQQPIIKQERLVLPKVSIKVEPEDSPEHTVNYDVLGLPPTPPSSNTSDSEGSLSPQRSAPSSPIRHSPYTRQHSPTTAAVRSITTEPLFTSPIPQSGVLILTEEEKRTLITEGYPIPTKLPLTKQEEKNLKKIRRKIKNKISAQESRRKKKEYVETLERRVESFNQENCDLKKKVDHLETNNRSLMSQLQKLQALVGKLRPSTPSSTGTGTCLMVLVMCFAIFLGGWSPTSLSIGYTNRLPAPVKPQPISGPDSVAMGPEVQDATVDAYTTPNVRSRLLMSIKEDPGDDDQYGPHTPFSYQNIFIGLFSSSNPTDDSNSLEMEPPAPRVANSQGEVKTPQGEVNDPHTEVNYTEVKVRQAIMHPDISADVTVDNRLNATA